MLAIDDVTFASASIRIMQHKVGHYSLVVRTSDRSVKKVKATAEPIQRNAFDGRRVGTVCLGDIISVGKLDDSGDIKSDAIKYLMA